MGFKDWILFVGPLIGVLIGAGITSIVKVFELRYLKQQESQKLLLSKLEELHQSISEYVSASMNYTVGVIKTTPTNVLQKIISPNPSLDKATQITDILLQPLPRINTMLKIYAPELEEQWNKLTDSVIKLNQSGADYMSTKVKDKTPVETNYQEVMKICQNLLAGIEKKSAQILLIEKEKN